MKIQKGEELADLFLSIQDPSVLPFHPSASVRNGFFNIFKRHLNFDKGILDDLFLTDFNDSPKLLKALQKLSDTKRSEVLDDFANWLSFREVVLGTYEKGPEIPFRNVDGKKVYESAYQKAIALKEELAQHGIKTEFVPGRTNNQNPEGFGFLVITAVDPGFQSPGISPQKAILKSAEFQSYLDKVQEEQGVIAIDPTLLSYTASAAAYFGDSGAIDGTRYILGIRPDTSGGDFVHEWQHKVDGIDQDNRLPGQIFRRNVKRRKSALGKALYRTGQYLEDQYLSELNATGKEYELYFETKKFPLMEFANTVIYRSKNQRRVAMGRIFMDPANPKHYLLYLRGGAKFVVPAYLGIKGFIMLLNSIFLEEEESRD